MLRAAAGILLLIARQTLTNDRFASFVSVWRANYQIECLGRPQAFLSDK